MKIRRIWRRPRRSSPIRELALDIFDEHTDLLEDRTRDLITKLATRQTVPGSAGSAPELVTVVRRHRQSLLNKVDEDLALLELIEQVQRKLIASSVGIHALSNEDDKDKVNDARRSNTAEDRIS